MDWKKKRKKKGFWRNLKNIEGKNKEQLKAIEDQEKKQLDAIKENNKLKDDKTKKYNTFKRRTKRINWIISQLFQQLKQLAIKGEDINCKKLSQEIFSYGFNF